MSMQLLLALGPKDSVSFDSYHAAANAEAIGCLRALRGGQYEPGVYLWGVSGVGKTHLLQAVCHAAGQRAAAAAYLPMRQLAERFSCDVLDGMENVDVVCIDDIDAVAARSEWETALTRLLVRVGEAGSGLVVSGLGLPNRMGLGAEQLSSRLAGGLVFQLQPLDEQEKLPALQRRAARRGMTLPTEAGRYLVRHYGQDTGGLFDTLEILDRESLSAKRRLTIPFIRDILGGVK
jgi:DnaA family protein